MALRRLIRVARTGRGTPSSLPRRCLCCIALARGASAASRRPKRIQTSFAHGSKWPRRLQRGCDMTKKTVVRTIDWAASTILAGRRQLSWPVRRDRFSPYYSWFPALPERCPVWRRGVDNSRRSVQRLLSDAPVDRRRRASSRLLETLGPSQRMVDSPSALAPFVHTGRRSTRIALTQ